ncbi:hypothetical protein QQX98_000487 [Neonectria punicea]|uniref:Uncharacterized protein n=1 Tax=Neonectria punicea TaxID=979145 RepID=A0ABR1HU84_9HYPO
MDWWNDLWLKEGFATWADWNVWKRFTCEGLQAAFQLDSLRASHAIDVDIKNGPDIDEIFDDISYLKGSSLVRMLDSYLGRDVFLEGAANYLRSFAYRNAVSTDLWHHLSKASNKDVGSFMDSWINQTGLPVLDIELKNGLIHLSQKRLLLAGDLSTTEEDTWWIPLNLPQSLGGMFKESHAKLKVDLEALSLRDLAKVNQHQTGFYKVNYSSDILAELAKEHDALTAEEKICLVADLADLVVAGKRSLTDLMMLIEGFRTETDHFVWLQISKTLGLLTSNFSENAPLACGLLAFKRRLLEVAIAAIDWDLLPNENHVSMRRRALIIRMAGMAVHEKTVERALQTFEDYVSGTFVHSSLLPAIFPVVSAHGKLSHYSTLKSLYLNAPSTSIDLGEVCLRALTATSSREALDDYLSLLLSTDMQVSDLPIAAGALSTRHFLRSIFWKWLKENWEEVLLKFDGSWPSLDHFLRQGLSGFAEEGLEEEVRVFFSEKKGDADSIGIGKSNGFRYRQR